MKIRKWLAVSFFLTIYMFTANPVSVSAAQTAQNERVMIDYTNASSGIVTVNFTGATASRLKVQVAASGITYTYDLTPGVLTTFPLSEGDGDYKVTVYENVAGTKYATVLSASFQVTLSSELMPFLLPNQYVDYGSAQATLLQAADLVSGVENPLGKVEKVHDYVVGNLTYDTQKAATVASGYLPVLDTVLAAKTGICFDYAALMAGMLRSQGVPCKLVVGYAGTAYHAWVSVWTGEEGWVDGMIYFDGKTWQRMDPTFASSGGKSAGIMEYIGNESNYTRKYQY